MEPIQSEVTNEKTRGRNPQVVFVHSGATVGRAFAIVDYCTQLQSLDGTPICI